jgi:hypothetical protein
MDTAARIQECDPEPVLHMAMELISRKLQNASVL